MLRFDVFMKLFVELLHVLKDFLALSGVVQVTRVITSLEQKNSLNWLNLSLSCIDLWVSNSILQSTFISNSLVNRKQEFTFFFFLNKS